MAHQWSIYTLADPRTDLVRYVGKTTMSLPKRLSRHLGDARRGLSTHKDNWLRGLLADGLKPRVSVLETGEGEDTWQEREKFWIAFYRAWGGHLTNHHDGGNGTSVVKNRVMSEQTRAKIAATLTGRKYTEEQKAAHQKQYQSVSAETRKKQSDSLKGRVFSEEHRAKLSLRARMKAPISDETRRKMSAAQRTGNTHHGFTKEATLRGWETRRANKLRKEQSCGEGE